MLHRGAGSADKWKITHRRHRIHAGNFFQRLAGCARTNYMTPTPHRPANALRIAAGRSHRPEIFVAASGSYGRSGGESNPPAPDRNGRAQTAEGSNFFVRPPWGSVVCWKSRPCPKASVFLPSRSVYVSSRRKCSRTPAPGIAVAYKGGHEGCDGSGATHLFRATARPRAVALAEDPPFGGLWCDQPAPFFLLPILWSAGPISGPVDAPSAQTC
jgi:hypothetical protein